MFVSSLGRLENEDDVKYTYNTNDDNQIKKGITWFYFGSKNFKSHKQQNIKDEIWTIETRE